jgi:hypothetical protein
MLPRALSISLCLGFWAAGCSSAPHVAPENDGGEPDTGFGPVIPYVDGGLVDAGWKRSEAGFVVPDAGVIPANRFVTNVVSYMLGPCSGFGRDQMPTIVEGPPVGGGTLMGSLDVLSLGNGGEIIVSFEPNAIVDGPGVDFIIFENPFYIGGNPDHIYAEPAEVSVSDDGVSWTSFTPCTDTTNSPPYQDCAGIHPVLSNPDNGISPLDPKTAGGDPYDLATIGVKHAKYVRIVDKVIEDCPEAGPHLDTNGFDLDAIAIVNAELP